MNLFVQEPLRLQHNIVETQRGRGRYYETPTGCYPSVTTVLSMADHTWLDEWRKEIGEEEANRITREAAERGTRLHTTLELYLKNDPDYDNMSWMTRDLFNQVRNPLKNLITKVYAQEIPLYSKVLRTAGRCDCIAEIYDRPHIVDFKNSRNEKLPEHIGNYHMQVSAYGVMANENFGLTIKDYLIIIANVQENQPTLVFGKIRDHIGEFVELRKKFDESLS